VYLLVFQVYTVLTKCRVQETKPPAKNLVGQRWAEGFNSGIKGLTVSQQVTASSNNSADEKKNVHVKLMSHFSSFAVSLVATA
jgi:nucleoside recognition membrane protein YjiH